MSRRAAGGGAGWLVLLFVLSLPLVTTRIYATDEVQYFAYARSALKDGDFAFENEFLALTEEGSIERSALLSVPRTATGRVVSHGTPGFAVFWAPWFALGDLLARVGGWPTDGYAWPYVAAICYGSALYAFLALLLLRAIALRYFAPWPVNLATLAAWWATALPFYMYVTPPMAHATSLFAVSLFLWAWHATRPHPSWIQAAATGLLGGLAVSLRETNVLFLVVFAVDLGAAAGGALRDRAPRPGAVIGRGVAFAAAVLIGFSPQLLAWNALYGSLLPPSSRTSYLEAGPVHLLSLLLSPHRGLLIWHPIWIPAIVGLVLFARRHGRVGGSLLAVLTAEVLLLASVANWSGGMAYGQRRLLACLFVVVLGLAEIHRRLPRRAALAAVALLVWLNLSLLLQFATGMIPRQGDVSWARIARNHVIEVPRRAWDIGSDYLLGRDALTGR